MCLTGVLTRRPSAQTSLPLISAGVNCELSPRTVSSSRLRPHSPTSHLPTPNPNLCFRNPTSSTLEDILLHLLQVYRPLPLPTQSCPDAVAFCGADVADQGLFNPAPPPLSLSPHEMPCGQKTKFACWQRIAYMTTLQWSSYVGHWNVSYYVGGHGFFV